MPALTAVQQREIGQGSLLLDQLTKSFIHGHLSCRLAGLRLRERYRDPDRGPFTADSQDRISACEVTAALAG